MVLREPHGFLRRKSGCPARRAGVIARGEIPLPARERAGDGATTFFIAPDGREYVEAKPFETADLLVISETVGIPETRLRLYATSHVAKKGKKDEKVELTQQERVDAKKRAVT